MSSLLQADPEQVKRFIFQKVQPPRFSAVIAVSVDRYPSELFATIWVGQEPDAEMREYTRELEAELRNLGVICTIVVKTDRDLSLGGTHNLSTTAGDFTYKFYRIDSVKDEDIVYIYALCRGRNTGRVPSRVEIEKWRILPVGCPTTNWPPSQAAAGGMRHGEAYQEVGTAA